MRSKPSERAAETRRFLKPCDLITEDALYRLDDRRRSQKRQHHEALFRHVDYAVFFVGRDKYRRAAFVLSSGSSHGKTSGTFQNEIDLVGIRVLMGALRLAGLEAVHFGDHVIGRKNSVLLHLVRGKAYERLKIDRFHAPNIPESDKNGEEFRGHVT